MRQLILILLAVYLLPAPAIASGQIAIIIDDVGYNVHLGKRATDLEGAFTLAILPFTPHTQELAERAHRNNKEIMLHLPMSNTRNLPLGVGGLVSGMSRTDFINTLRADLKNIPHLRGLNNHMGSQLTQEQEPMEWLMDELSKQGLYFVDSRTSANTKALSTAQRYGVPSGKRDIFLDNVRDQVTIKKQLLKAVSLAAQQEVTIAIGHPYPETLDVLEHAQDLLTRHNITLVPASSLLSKSPAQVLTINVCYAPPLTLWHRPAPNFIELPQTILDLL